MAKPIEKTKAALKLRTNQANKALTLRVKGKKHLLPVETRTLESEEFVFVHIPPAAEIFKIEENGLRLVTDDTEAEAAVMSFRKSRRAKTKEGRSPAMPVELAQLLSKLPTGYKLGYDANGAPKLVKTRRRRKAAK